MEAAVVTLPKLVASSRPTSADVPVSAAVELTCGANEIWRAPRRKFHISRRQVKSEHSSAHHAWKPGGSKPHCSPGLTISFSGEIPVIGGNGILFRNFGEFRRISVDFGRNLLNFEF